MGFTTQIFLFCFFPISFALYALLNGLHKTNAKIKTFIEKFKLREVLIILISLIFYYWTGITNLVKLVFYIFLVYAMARCIDQAKQRVHVTDKALGLALKDYSLDRRMHFGKLVCIASVIILTFYLIAYKYLAFIFSLINSISNTGFTASSILAPVGLSFITFSAISYIVDVYKEKATAGSFIDCALFITFFPKIISGPIVLWKNFQHQIGEFEFSLDQMVSGINRIIIGFAKKIILADTFGAWIASISSRGFDPTTAVLTMFIYMLQIYYDFAGYSDIAIGLSRLFGFKVKDNFNFPYKSKSITEFWRRWHISLGTWFREYIYIPLGGNRKGKARTLVNLAIVFVLTGIWHGAGWNYILWGGVNAFFILIERLIKDTKFYKKIPAVIKWFFTMVIVLFFWQLFRFQSLEELKNFFGVMFGTVTFKIIPYTWQYYLGWKIITFSLIGALGATVLSLEKVKLLYQKLVATKTGFVIQEIVLIVIFAYSIIMMVSSTYSPFIYFQY